MRRCLKQTLPGLGDGSAGKNTLSAVLSTKSSIPSWIAHKCLLPRSVENGNTIIEPSQENVDSRLKEIVCLKEMAKGGRGQTNRNLNPSATKIK
jgi:hypothetical protein